MNLRQIFTLDLTILSVSSAALGSGLLSGLFMFYYVKVFLEIYKIDQTWLNIAQIFYIVCNTISEPLLGYLQDYGCKPCRNRRRVILFGGPLFAAVFVYPWFNWYDPDTSAPWMAGVHLITVLFLWNFMFTLIGSALCGLFAEVSTDHEHRVRQLTYNECAYLIGSAAVFPVEKLSSSLNDFYRFRICIIVVAVLSTLCYLVTGLRAPDEIAQTKKRNNPDQNDDTKPLVPDEAGSINDDQDEPPLVSVMDPVATVSEPHSLKQASVVVVQVFKSKDFWCAIGGNFMGWLRIQISANFMAIFTEGLVSSRLLPSGSYSIATFYLLCQIIPRVVIIVTSPLSAKFGIYRMLMASYVLTWLNSAIGLILGSLVSYDFIVGTVLVDSILIRFQVMYMVVFSDFIDEDTKKYKRKLPASTLIFTLNGLLVKPTVALAPMIVVALLNIGSYDEYKDDIRNGPPRLKFIMFLTCCCIPAAVSILAFLSMFKFSLKDKHLIKDEQEGPLDIAVPILDDTQVEPI